MLKVGTHTAILRATYMASKDINGIWLAKSFLSRHPLRAMLQDKHTVQLLHELLREMLQK